MVKAKSSGIRSLGLIACTLLAAMLLSPTGAQAACTPAATAAPIAPADGTTVTCSGATTDQNPPNGYGTGDQNNLTINVVTGATVTGTANPSSGVAVNAGNTINNAGAISGFTNGISTGGDVTVVNQIGASTIFGNVFGMTSGGSITLTNAGHVTSSTTAVNAGTSVNITNSGTIDGPAAAIVAGTSGIIVNSGTINSATNGITIGTDANITNTSTGTIFGNSFGVTAGGSISLDNSGSIQSSLTGVNAGGNVSGSNAITGTIFGNVGGIKATGSVTLNNAGHITSSTNAVDAGTSVDITNSGTIDGPSRAIVAGTSGIIVNSGTINSATVGITIGTDASITNTSTGTIFGNSFGVTAGGNISLDNSGSINSSLTGVNAGGDFSGSNATTGTIFGNVAGISATGSVTLNNAGQITSSTNGVSAGTSVAIINSGTISGPHAGILAGTSGVVTNSGSITGSTDGINVGTNVSVTNLAAGTIFGNASGIRAGGVVTLDNAGSVTTSDLGVTALAGNITNSGTISGPVALFFSGGPSTVFDSGILTGAGGTAIQFAGTGNTLSLAPTFVINGNVLGTGADTLVLDSTGSGTFNVSNIGAGQQYQGFAAFQKSGTSTWTLTGSGAQNWVINQGTLIGDTTSIQGSQIVDNGVLDFNQTFNGAYNGVISGSGTLQKDGSGTVTLTGANSYTGPTAINGGTLQMGAANVVSAASAVSVSAGAVFDLNSFNQSIGSLAGAGNVTLGAAILTTGNDGTNTTYSGTMSGTGGLTKVGGGIFNLSGTNTYTGPTTINAGKLSVNGSIASSSLTTVNAGGTLGGNGTVGNTNISGGTLSPGNSIGTITIAGNLAFSTAATYLVEVSGASADRTNVTGTASLAGTVRAQFSGGTVVHRYTILSAGGGRSSVFDALTTTGLPGGFAASLIYTNTDALLNIQAMLGSSGGLNQNQNNVAGALNNFFNSGGALPAGFFPIFGLTGSNLGTALSQLSGEAATGSQLAATQMMTEFLTLMLDPFVDGRGGTMGSGSHGFAAEQQASFPPDVALAYAGVFKAPPKPAAAFDQRWSAWGTGFGGYNKTSGDPVVGSNNITARDYGFAGGMDYHFSPDTVGGFALAGGGTNWGLAQGLGGGRSDAFQAGLYGKTQSGPAYVAASLAFANHWMSTDRTAFAGDHLTASFNAQSFGGRVEAGYRYGLATIGVTPYLAAQAQTFHTPAYNETDVTAGGFGLGYFSRNASDTRSEVGARFDEVTTLNAMPLILRARAAWAHDWVSDPSLMATFQTLPGASFIVTGATPAKNSALASAGAELHVTPQLSVAAKFDGEFARGAQTYAGTGTVRYAW